MDLINEEITHKVFGEGNIIAQDGSFVTVDFNEDIKKFVYPDAFGQYMTLNNQEIAKSFETILKKNEKKEALLEKKRVEKRAQLELERRRQDMLRNLQIHESSQIVFWLDEEEQQSVFTDWHAFTGTVQSGNDKGHPNRAARLRPNSAGLLTARETNQEETERRILGIYMVDDTFAGNLSDDGIVPAHAEHRIELTEEESEKMLFWNYYINKNHPHRTTWNSGKYRYFDNVWTAQILKDIIALRTDEKEIKAVENFLEYFGQMNAIDINNIPEADGALKQ